MNPGQPPSPEDANDEIAALIATLHETGQRLEELTAGEVDTVADRDGRAFLLRRAQEELRHIEAVKQAAILNALPAHIALLDTQGLIISVNEAWRRFGSASVVQGPGYEIGLNYVEMCDNARGDGASAAHQVAEGIRSVLSGGVKRVSIEYPCQGAGDQRWFLLTVTPLADDHPTGAIVMHLDVTAERQAEESLRASESRFRQMAEHIHDVFFLQNIDGTQIHYVSPAYEQLWGRTCESLYANQASWTDSIHPDDREHALTQFNEGQNTGFDYECRIVRPNGEIRWIHVRGFPIRDDAGNPYRTAGVASDITQRRHVSDELHESERRFRDMLSNVELVSLMLDRQARIIYCNDYLLRLTGWRREEVIGRDWFELFTPAGRDDVKDTFAALLADLPFASHHENAILTRSGQERLIQWSNTILRSVAGEVIGTASMGDDITERKEAEAALLESEERFRATFEQAAAGMGHTTLEGRWVRVNRRLCEIVGYTRDELLARTYQDITHPDDLELDVVGMRQLLANEIQTLAGEKRYLRKDGAIVWVELTVSTMRAPSGEPQYFIAVVQDITGRKELEQELLHAQRMEGVGQLAGGIAHDFNNLLTVIGGRGHLALAKLGPDDPLRRDLDLIQTTVDRASALTRQLLAFSRKQILQPRVVDPNDLVRNLTDLLERLIGEDIELVFQPAADLGRVRVDPGQLEQVIVNLAVNARDAMADGGRLTIETSNVALDAGHTGRDVGMTPGPYVMLAISDNGVGMDAATRARMFEPFFTTKGPGKGTGLGLSTVDGIVNQSGGRIQVYSEPGVGTVFKILFPRTDAGPEAEPPGDTTLPRGTETILLVEDEAEVRSLAREVLERLGYTLLEAKTGTDAVLIAARHVGLIDLLLTDVVMPRMGGGALAQAVTAARPETRILFMSGYTDDAIVRHGILEAGVQLLEKPFTPETLSRKVRMVLDRKR
jgi:PAS domain S-box-containing protein